MSSRAKAATVGAPNGAQKPKQQKQQQEPEEKKQEEASGKANPKQEQEQKQQEALQPAGSYTSKNAKSDTLLYVDARPTRWTRSPRPRCWSLRIWSVTSRSSTRLKSRTRTRRTAQSWWT